MNELDDAVIVNFPLRGEWRAVTSPADRIPSHGTNALAQRFAFDFLRLDDNKKPRFCPAGGLRMFLFGYPVRKCYCYGEKVYAPFEGTVVRMKDGLREPKRLYPIFDILRILKNALFFNPKRHDLQKVLGNYVILRKDNVFAFFAHLKPNSIKVNIDQEIGEGVEIGEVGHTGNSTAPHLHFHLMDSEDILTANGIPCSFKTLDVWKDEQWMKMGNIVPKKEQRIRF